MNEPSINLFVPKFRVEECLNELRGCLESGWTGQGPRTLEFESLWKEYSGSEHALFLSSATAALHISVAVLKEELGWNENDEIITTPLTFVSTNHAILYNGLKPVFADVDEFLCLNPKSVTSKISSRTRAVIFVGMGGNSGQLPEIREICDDFGLKLIIDASHMAGTKVDGIDPQSFGDATCYSFQAVKNLPTADSGMLCFRESKFDSEARKWSWLGINKSTFQRANAGNYKWNYDVEHLGFKYNGNDVMATLAIVGLRYLDQDNQRRRENFRAYQEHLSNSNKLQFVPTPANCVSSQHLVQILVEERDELITHLNSKGIYPGVHYKNNLDYHIYGVAADICPNASRISARALSLPNHLSLTNDEISKISNEILDFLK